MTRPILVDVFSGCGGFGLGGQLAGFHSAVAVDIDTTLQSAYKLNFPQTHTVTGDLSVMDENTWKLLLKDTKIDGVIGGPPCQGYSRIGKCDLTDERRTLLHHFFRAVNIIKPKFFIMENVEGLMDKKNRPELDKAMSVIDDRYTCLKPIIVDASKFGAPTRRKRVIVIGYDPSRMQAITEEDFIAPEITVTVKDAISDLPAPIPQTKDKTDYGWAHYAVDKNLSAYAKKMRTVPSGKIGWSKAKSKLRLKVGAKKTSGHFNTVHAPKIAKRYSETKPGMTDKISRSKKLEWDGLCPTLRAGTGSDKGSHQAVRPLHPDHGRVITVREAARLQGFPDWFCFHPTKWHSFRMIGNSVSPVVSEHLLSVVKLKLQRKIAKKTATL